MQEYQKASQSMRKNFKIAHTFIFFPVFLFIFQPKLFLPFPIFSCIFAERKAGPKDLLFSLLSHYSISISSDLSSSSDTYFPFFFLWRTHSERRYSICPLTERKSSSAQAAISPYSLAERRRGICFFCPSAILNTGCRNWLPAVHHGFRRELPEDSIP